MKPAVDYVVNTLRNSGFDVQTPEFSARVFHAEKGSVTRRRQNMEAHALEYSLGTPPDGVTGPLVATPANDSPGCTASDYDGLPVLGAVVLVDRGNCPFAQKEDAAAQRGAVAMIVVDNVDEQQMGGTLGADTEVKIPVVSVTKSERDAAARAARTGHRQAQCERPKLQGPQHHRADQDGVDYRRGDARRAPGQRARRDRASTTTAPG